MKKLLSVFLLLAFLLSVAASVGCSSDVTSTSSQQSEYSTSGSATSSDAEIVDESSQSESEGSDSFQSAVEESTEESSEAESSEPEIITEMTISNIDELNKSVNPQNGELKIPEDITTVIFSGDITAEKILITKPISVYVSGNVAVENGITFNVDMQGDIFVDDSENSKEAGLDFWFQTPLCNVIWDSDKAASLSYMEKYMNVFSYNGTETNKYMGGNGNATLVSAVITDNKSQKQYKAEIDGNCISVKSGYINKIDSVDFTVSGDFSENATCEIVSYNGTYYFVLKDALGNQRGYKVDIQQADFKLPIIRITSERDIDTKDEYINGTFSLDYNGQYNLDNLNELPMGIQGRGNSSWKLNKKPYKIKFESGQSLFGLEKAKRWVLVANHSDRSFIRNRLAYEVGDVLDNLVFVPNAIMVDVFVNGEYAGVYQLSEQIEINNGRVPGEEGSLEVDTDYLIELGGDGKGTSFGSNSFTHELFRFAEIKDPDEELLTKEQYEYVKNYVLKVENTIKEGGDYQSLLDVPSLVDWILLYEFSYNIDGMFRRSDFLLKAKGDKLYFATPWDFDYGFGNYSLDSDNYQEWICLGTQKTDDFDNYIPKNIMDYLMEDPYFIAQLKARWAQVGDKMLSTALATIDNAQATITPSAAENYAAWPELSDRIQYENRKTVKITTYVGQLDYLRSWVRNRHSWMNQYINSL